MNFSVCFVKMQFQHCNSNIKIQAQRSCQRHLATGDKENIWLFWKIASVRCFCAAIISDLGCFSPGLYFFESFGEIDFFDLKTVSGL
jgi:hypothetical protein